MGACLGKEKGSSGKLKSKKKEGLQPLKEHKSKKDDIIAITFSEESGVRKEPIEDFYLLGREIGRGGFSVVLECTEKRTGDKYAVKCIKKTMVEGEDIKLLRREIQIMKKISHPNILKLFDVFEDSDEFYLVMELYSFYLSIFIFAFLTFFMQSERQRII